MRFRIQENGALLVEFSVSEKQLAITFLESLDPPNEQSQEVIMALILELQEQSIIFH